MEDKMHPVGSSLQSQFDGMTIDIYGGRFNGGFDIDAADALDQRMDSETYFLVRAKVKGAALSETRNGDLCRTNIFAVAEATKLPNDLGVKITAALSAQMTINFESDVVGNDDHI